MLTDVIEKEDLLFEIMQAGSITASELCDMVALLCRTAKYCDREGLWEHLATRMGITTFFTERDVYEKMTYKQKVQQWCKLLNEATPKEVTRWLDSMRVQNPDFLSNPHFWTLILEALGVATFPNNFTRENYTDQRKFEEWYNLIWTRNQNTKYDALWRALGKRGMRGHRWYPEDPYKAHYEEVAWILENTDIAFYIDAEYGRSVFLLYAVQSGDIRIVKRMWSFVDRNISEPKDIHKSMVLENVIYHALAPVANHGLQSASEIWEFLRDSQWPRMNYVPAMQEAIIWHDLKTLRRIMERGLYNTTIRTCEARKLLAQDLQRRAMHQVNTQPNNANAKALLDWLEVELATDHWLAKDRPLCVP